MAPIGYSARALESRVLELNIISAQDLALVSRSMKTYVVAWVDPQRKLTTKVDQRSQSNPTWNEKFVFRVDNKFLQDNDSEINIEIYTAAWVKDALIGTVNVFISDLFGLDFDNSSAMKLISLQVRRPSGRPKGILRMGVALLDSTMRSLPMEISNPKDGDFQIVESRKNKKGSKLRRSQSDRTDLTTSEVQLRNNNTTSSSICSASVYNSTIVPKRPDSMVSTTILTKRPESMVSISDVGPSASVVAAAIAKGIFHRQKPVMHVYKDDCSSILEGTTEGPDARLERWRKEASPFQHNSYKEASSIISKESGYSEETGKLARRRRRRKNKKNKKKEEEKGLFSCFGNVFGCEISITCGGGADDEDSVKKGMSKNKVANLSAIDDDYSQSYMS